MHILIEAVSDVWHPQDIKYWPFRVASHVELLLKVSVFYCLYSQVIFCCVKAVKVIWLNSAQVSHLWSATWVGIALQCAAVCFFSFFFFKQTCVRRGWPGTSKLCSFKLFKRMNIPTDTDGMGHILTMWFNVWLPRTKAALPAWIIVGLSRDHA